MHRGNEIPFVKQNVTLREALLEMTQKGLGFICIINEDHKLVGVCTDGDLRRSLENGATIESQISSLMTTSVRDIV